MANNYFSEERYEDKFLLKGQPFNLNIKKIFEKNSLEKVHQDNCINNLYFDTRDFQFYSSHIEGSIDRFKIRLRWYTFSKYKQGEYFLEYKRRINKKTIKYKIKLPITNLNELNNQIMYNSLNTIIASNNLHPIQNNLKPILFNSYNRSYYFDKNNNNRITLDSNMSFSKASLSLKPIYFQNINYKIIEHKYGEKKNKSKINQSSIERFKRVNFSKYIFGLINTRKPLLSDVY